MTIIDEGESVLFVMTPGIKVTRGSLVIYCDHLVGWGARGEKGEMKEAWKGRLEEIYAEGNLRMENGDQTLEAERAYLNLVDGTALVVKARLATRTQKREVPIILSAEEFRKLGSGDMVGKEVTVTTCEFHVPDYKLVVKEVQIHKNWKSGDIDLYGLTVHVDPLGFPIFWLPYLPVQFGAQVPLRKLRYEKSSRFGNSVYSKFGIDISKTRRDAAGEPLLDESGERDTHRWGSLLFDVDYLELRGVGSGPEWEYEWDDYRGMADFYYINDSGRSPSSDFNDRFLPVQKEDRGRMLVFHRHRLWGPLQADFEFHRLSDRNFREEFLEKEFKNDKEPETYGLLRFNEDNFGMTALFRTRINDFQNQVEYLPQVTQSLLTHPLFRRIYFSHNAQYANVRFRKDRDVPDADQPRMNRFDIDESLTLPFAVGPVRFLPFATARYTGYDYGRFEPDGINRYTGAVGARARIAFWRLFDVKSTLLGLDGIRHTASAETRYFHQRTSTPSSELFPFDAVDQVDDFQEFAFEVRNRFETKNPVTGEIYDALNFGVAVEYYPDPHRDTRRLLRQNTLYPAGWIAVANNDEGKFRSRKSSNINFDLSFSLRDILTFQATADFSPYAGKIEETHGELRFKPADNLTLRLTQQYVIRLTHAVGIGVEWRISDKWTVGGKTEYDFSRSEALEHSYFVRRDLHDFDLEVGFKRDEGRDETSASVSIQPHGKRESRLQAP